MFFSSPVILMQIAEKACEFQGALNGTFPKSKTEKSLRLRHQDTEVSQSFWNVSFSDIIILQSIP
jgi:hypothetical protein